MSESTGGATTDRTTTDRADLPRGTIATRYGHKLEDGRLQCDLCPRHCKLREGQTAFCLVRARQGDEVVLTSYGRSSGFCVDPIEKKPSNHFLPGSAVFSFGTAGCNLACRFCQNWDISKSREFDTLAAWAGPEQVAAATSRHGCASVAYTYNDPVIFHEYAIDVARACHPRGIRSVAVSAGYVCPKPRAEFYAHMDAANIDLKAFSEEFYWKVTGAHLQPVLDTLQYIRHQTSVWLEATTLLIPGLNDSDDEIAAMSRWVVEALGPDVPIHFTAFHPAWRMTDRPATPPATVKRARRIARENGVRYAYTGNIRDPEGASTYCHSGGQRLIERAGYSLGEWNLTVEGKCNRCQTPCAGVFLPNPGTGNGIPRRV